MNVLFLGLGSIGQRHLQNLQSVYGGLINYYAVRKTSHNIYIKDGVAEDVNNLAELYGLIEFYDIDEAFKAVNFDIVYITNPSSFHYQGIVRAIDEGCAVFVEKPLCTNVEETKRIHQVYDEKSFLYVGYQTQFDPLYQRVKDLISGEQFGAPVSFRSEWCTYLPDHHKYEDYRSGYAARRNLGGGVLLGLSHELEIISDLFGLPESVASVESKNRHLEIEADDTYSVLCKFRYHDVRFGGTLNLSYSQIFETRFLSLHFEKGFISCDFVNRTCTHMLEVMADPEIITSDVTRNDIFTNQTIAFIDAVKGMDYGFGNFEHAVDVIKFIDAIREGAI